MLNESCTLVYLDFLTGALDKCDDITDNVFPTTSKLAAKMINLQQQHHYQSTTRTNGCLPKGIARQCKFTFSGNNPQLQEQLQLIFNEAGSRTLDLIIENTSRDLQNSKRRYYSSLDQLKSKCHESGHDFNNMHQKIQTTIRQVKSTTNNDHSRKLNRDLNQYKLYTKPDQPVSTTLAPKQKRNRRFKKITPKKKPPRRPKHRSKRQKLKSTGLPKTIDINKYFYNLTSLELTEHHKVIFSLGQKFCPTPKSANWSEFETAIDNWSYLLRYAVYYHNKPQSANALDYERILVKRTHRRPINNSGQPALELFIQKVRNDLLTQRPKKYIASNISSELQSALREMKFWEKDQNIIIRPYDKGQGYFIDYKLNYRERIVKELQSDLYEMIIEQSTMYIEVVDIISSWCCKWENEHRLTPTLCQWITPDATRRPGFIYMNYKRHKPQSNFPGRLITSGVGSLTENLSSLVALELKPLVLQLPHVLIDTNHLLRRLQEINGSNIIKKDDNIIHVSWDVVAMFPNIPEEMGITECDKLLDGRPLGQGLPTKCILEALKICLHYNISQFDGDWYRQVRGAAMGPHEACFYSDIAMSRYDRLVMSDSNPCKKPLVWARYRDDIYDPWPHGETELLKFTAWLNSICESIQFTVSYSIGNGVEFLDTCIYDRDGVLHTDLYSKPSDTHAYLPPSSCHPYHICRNNPNQIARRVRKLCSEETSYSLAREKFTGYITDRGYSEEVTNEAFDRFENIEREVLFNSKENIENSDPSQKSKRCFPLVSEYNPYLPAVPPVLNKHKHILRLDPVVNAAIPQDSIFASYKQPKSIKDLLVHSRFTSNVVEDNVKTNMGCKSCSKCYLCKSYIVETDTFKSYECDTVFKIKHDINCSTEGVIYLLLDEVCKRSYVGSTIDSMKTRMSNYKNHLKISHKGCEMAQHFAQCPDTHSLYSDDAVSSRSKIFIANFDAHLGKQLRVVLIDFVDLSCIETTKQKRDLIEIREGYWQTQLRTLSRYGGLNKKDERKLSNSRLAAKTRNVTVSPSPSLDTGDREAKSSDDDSSQDDTSDAPGPSVIQDQPEVRRSSRIRQKTKLCHICE